MDLFFDVWLKLKNVFWLSRTVKTTLWEGIEIKVYSGDDLIINVKDDLGMEERAYLTAAKELVGYAERNIDHAKSATRKGSKWVQKLNELLAVDSADKADS